MSLFDKGKLLLKGVLIFVMALALWIPTFFIMALVREREGRQEEAIADVSNKWAGKQTVMGPIITVPYFEHYKNDQGVSMVARKNVYFMPEKMHVRANVVPEKRHRGIYEVIVYRSEIEMSGKFGKLDWQQLKIAPENLLWNEAALLFQVSDPSRGVNEDLFVKWNDTLVRFNAQQSGFSGIENTFVAPITLSPAQAEQEHNYDLRFALNGSGSLLFSAMARENKVDLSSTWPDPSFTGVKLPDSREVGDTGFVANWKYMNRSIPLVWNNTVHDPSESSVGADLLIAVDSYNKTERSVKYALLCIVLTFASFFLIETIYRKPLHLVQYGLAGLALVLFYTLLLSISEYTGFNLAYLIASVATIGLVGWYVGGIMKSSRLALFTGFVLAVVYGYIFTIIQLQDYALLMGSIGLFVALAIIMYFSRRIIN